MTPLIASFFGVMSFVAAEPVTAPEFAGKTFPPDWRAAYANHGRYLEGFLMREHPVVLACLLATLLACVGLMWRIHQAQQQMALVAPHASRVGRRWVFGAWLLCCVGFVLVVIPRLEVTG